MSRQSHQRNSPAAVRERERRRSLVAGLLGIAAMALICFLAFSKDNPFSHGYRMGAVFSSSNQIRSGSPVRIAGVTIGEVTGTADGPGETQVVEMEISDEGLPIHTDATARIRPRVFLEGGYYVDLRPGSPSAGELEADGAPIPLAQTAVPVQLDQVLSAFDRPARDSLLALFDRFAYALDGDAPASLGELNTQLEPLLRNGAWLAEALQGSEPDDVSKLITGAERASGVLAEREARLASLITNLNLTAAAFASHDRELSLTLREAAGLVAAAPAALDSLDRALPPLERFLASLRPALPDLAPALDDAGDLLHEANGLVGPDELPRLIDAVRPLLEVLPEEIPGLTALFGEVGTLTACVGERIVPLLQSELPDAEHSTGQPVWQELAHALVGNASSASVFDGNGPILRMNGLVGERSLTLNSGGGEPLFATPPLDLLGTRPRWLGPGVELPYEPDAPCTEQAPPDLAARTGAASLSSVSESVPAGRVPFELSNLGELEELIDGIAPPAGEGG